MLGQKIVLTDLQRTKFCPWHCYCFVLTIFALHQTLTRPDMVAEVGLLSME